jgi:tRNA(Ile)-lysidine synthase
MPAANGRYLRPFLGVRRSVTEDACAALGLQPWEDPHNSDPSFQRVRLRTEVLPLLEDVLQGGVAEALARTADLVRADLEFVDQQIASIATQPSTSGDQQTDSTGIRSDWSVDHDGGALRAEALAELPGALRPRALRAWAAAVGAASVTSVHIASLDALVTGWHGQGAVDLPGGVRVRRASGRIEVIPPPPDQQES